MTRPAPDSVQVWATSTLAPFADEHTLRTLLTPAERRRADRFRQSEDRRRSIIARAALRIVLGRCLDLRPQDVVIDSDAAGKPFLRAADPVHFSVTHSGERIMIALSAAEVGVDVEQVRPLDDIDHIADRFLAPDEARALGKLQPAARLAAFFRCWTRKEALLKALGTGLRMPLRSFAVSVSADEPPALLSAVDPAIAAGPWTLVDAPPAPGYAAAVAVRAAAASVQLRDWPPPLI